MILSNTSKGATRVIIMDNPTSYERRQKTTKLHQIIDEMVECTHLNKSEALAAASVMINAIKNHLIEGNNINLGSLGTLCPKHNEDLFAVNGSSCPTSVQFNPSDELKNRLIEKSLLQH